jgi:AhpC/TSA family protein
VHREYGPRGLAVVAVNIEESRETVAPWVVQKKLSMPVLLDPPGVASHAYGITATPTAFAVSRDGRLLAKALGTKDWTSSRGRAFLDLLLAR